MLSKIRKITKKSVKRILRVDILFNIDSPQDSLVVDRVITVDGWVVSKKSKNIKLLIKNNSNKFEVERKVSRADVAESLGLDGDSKKCGFTKRIKIEDGDLDIYIDDGRHLKKIFSKKIIYSPEK